MKDAPNASVQRRLAVENRRDHAGRGRHGIRRLPQNISSLHLGRVTDKAGERVRGGNAASFLGDNAPGTGMQIAIYDVVGRALEVPVYRLFSLPRVRDRCPLAWWNTKAPPTSWPRRRRMRLPRAPAPHVQRVPL